MVNTSPQTAEKCKRTRAWERRKEHRPGELLDAALEVFVARGYAAARLDDVAARAGVSKGTLYLYYAGKEDLFKAVVRVNIVPVIEQFRQRIEQATGSNEELLTNVLTDWWHCFSQPHIGGIIKLIIAEASNFPEIACFFHEEVASIGHGVIRQLIQRGVERQEFRKPCEMDVAAHLVMSPLVMKLIWAHSMTQCGVPQLVPCGAEFIHHHVALILSLLRTPGTGLPGSSASAGDTTCLAPAGNQCLCRRCGRYDSLAVGAHLHPALPAGAHACIAGTYPCIERTYSCIEGTCLCTAGTYPCVAGAFQYDRPRHQRPDRAFPASPNPTNPDPTNLSAAP